MGAFYWKASIRSWDLVEHLFDASVSPERLDELISVWDTQISSADPEGLLRLANFSGSVFAQQVSDVMRVLETLRDAELRHANDLLSSLLGAAMVLSDDGTVVAANEAATAVFGLRPGGSVLSMPFDAPDLDELAAKIASVSGAAGSGREEVVQVRPARHDRVVLVHLKAMADTGSGHVLAVTSELAWPDAVSKFLSEVFRLTAAEVAVMQRLVAGDSVTAIVGATGRTAGTVRSQLHAIMQKTSTRNQSELVRLGLLLMQSVPAEAPPPRLPPAAEPRQRFLRMPDGRRIEVLSFGDPAGQPVIWMQSTYGFWRLPRAAEEDLARRGLRVLVPFRAGWCGSDPVPQGRNPLEVAVGDMRAVMLQLRLPSAVVVAPGDDIRIALMLAQADPDRVRAIVGIGSGFPISTDSQYRRLIPVARFVRSCARHSPGVLPFLTRVLRMTVSRYGLERYMRSTLARIPPDARAIADPDIASAWVSAATKLIFAELFRDSTFAAELVLFHEDWPAGLGHVGCPVTLIHGEQDCNAPFETALEYAATYPEWRVVSYPDEGQFVAHVRWRDVLDLVKEAGGVAAPSQVAALTYGGPAGLRAD